MAYWNTYQLVRSFNAVGQSYKALEILQTIQGLMESAESSVSNYVITGHPDRLRPYQSARGVVPRRLREVEALMTERPKPRKTLRRLRRSLMAHLSYLGHVVDLRQAEGYATAAQEIEMGDDLSTRDMMERLLKEVQREAGSAVKQRSTLTSEHSSKAKAVLIFAAGVSLGLMAWVFSLLQREKDERRETESANARLETFLRSIVEHIPYMILVKEATNLRLFLVNKAATEWLGHSEDELLGSNEYDLRPREAAKQAMEQDREILQKGEPVDIPEERFVRNGQEERLLHTQKIPILDETGIPAYLVTISEDITERKQAEQVLEMSRDTAVQSERLKSEFIRNMSHEIRTPLSIALGMATLLLDTELTPGQRRFAGTVQHAMENLSTLTKDILTFSKIESGTFTLEIHEMNVRKGVEDVVTMLGEQAKAKGVGLASLIPREIPSTVLGDSIRLRQVLTQLMGNAVKFTSRGEVIVRVSETRQDESHHWLTYKISDTGVGIPAEAQKHLFEPFRQGDGSPTRRFGGTGLGLAMSKRIVELMGGEIGFESVSGQGSTFWCTIPFEKQAGGRTDVKGLSGPWTRARVLVVDENETLRQLIRQQLTAWTLASEGVASGETALELLRREQKAGRPFQIVVLDMHLLDMDSVTFARAVKNDPALDGTKLLVMTNAEPSLDPSTLTSLGYVGCISKPPKADTLYERLATLIEPPDKDRRHAA